MDSTKLNDELSVTMLNNSGVSKTSINTTIEAQNSIDNNTVLLDKYVVTGKLDVNTGEADMYLCESEGKQYIAKIYRREAAVKKEIVNKLKNIDSPYVAKTLEIGTYNDFPFEIMPFYKNGSMARRIESKLYTINELKNEIVPQINEALRVLHSNGVIHKDLKPSNIMIQDDGHSIALIDFGVSSVVEDNNTVIVTRTGMTPEYSAPEATLNVFLDESDYYSFGITLYELFAGYTPFKNMTNEQKAQFAVTKELPFPQNMPSELKDLILGLTYVDITHRNDKDNPNRRWTYDEVGKWCAGIKQPVPGESKAVHSALSMPPYKFLSETYTDIHSLVTAMYSNWEEGKKQLFRGILSGFFKNFSPELAGYCVDAEELVDSGASLDSIFCDLLYNIDEDLTGICWKGQYWKDPKSFGAYILEKLRSGDISKTSEWYEMISNKVLSKYAARFFPDSLKSFETIETSVRILGPIGSSISHDQMLQLYILGYLISEDRTYHKDGQVFNTLDELTEYMKKQLDISFEKFAEFCKTIINSNNILEPQFESWLIALGKTKELQKWRSQLAR